MHCSAIFQQEHTTHELPLSEKCYSSRRRHGTLYFNDGVSTPRHCVLYLPHQALFEPHAQETQPTNAAKHRDETLWLSALHIGRSAFVCVHPRAPAKQKSQQKNICDHGTQFQYQGGVQESIQVVTHLAKSLKIMSENQQNRRKSLVI